MTEPKWMQPSDTLVEILDEYNINGFEKPGGTDKNTIHNYTGIYEKILSPFVDKQGQLLEIGVQHGGSSLLWQSYLPKFSLCLVDLVDIVNPWIWQCMDQNENDYSFYEGDAYNTKFVEDLKVEWGGFDVIIDDGPHTLNSQLFTVKQYLPLLNPGGVLAIEDIQNPDEDAKVLTNALDKELQKNVELYDVRTTKGRYDDFIFVVKF